IKKHVAAVAALESEVGNPNAAVFGCMIEFRSVLPSVAKVCIAAFSKHLCPSLVAIWCVAHRLELTALDCLKQLPKLKELNEQLRIIHKHYTVSSKASRELEEISKAMEVSILRPFNILMGTQKVPAGYHTHRMPWRS
ncbi:unnamed protein product, partial [Boreogadus saida]